MGINYTYVYECACYIIPVRYVTLVYTPNIRDITILMDIDPLRRDCAVKRYISFRVPEEHLYNLGKKGSVVCDASFLCMFYTKVSLTCVMLRSSSKEINSIKRRSTLAIFALIIHSVGKTPQIKSYMLRRAQMKTNLH